MKREEGHYTIKVVDKLPKRGNSNWLYTLKEDNLAIFYFWTLKNSYNKVDLADSISTDSTSIQAGTNISITGTGTSTDPFVVNSLPIPQYTLDINANSVRLLSDGNVVSTEDLSLYLDDTNLARLVSGVLDSNTGIATFTRDDSTIFTINFSSLIGTPITNTSELTNDGENGTDPFITANDLIPTVSTDIFNQITSGTDGGAFFQQVVTSLTKVQDELLFFKEDGNIDTVDLSPYLDNTNLSRLVSGILDSNTNLLTLTRDDNTEFSVDLSALAGGGGAFEEITESGNTGIVRAGRDSNNYGDIGSNAIDFTINTTASTTKGVTGFESIGFGNGATVGGTRTFGVGFNATVLGQDTILIGNSGFADSSGIGLGAFTNVANNGVGIGRSSRATSDGSVAIGLLSNVRSSASIAIGQGSEVGLSTAAGIAIGLNAEVTREGSIAIGRNCISNGFDGFALHTGQSEGNYSRALAHSSTAYSYFETVVGGFATDYAVASPVSELTWQGADRVFTVGNGQNDTNRSDALIVLKDGTLTAPSLTNTIIDSASSDVLVTKDWAQTNLGGGGATLGNWVDLTLLSDATANRARYRVKGNTVEIDIYGLRLNSINPPSGRVAYLPSTVAPNIGGTTASDDAYMFIPGFNLNDNPTGNSRGVAMLGIRGLTSSATNSYSITVQSGSVNPTDFLIFYGQYEIL